MISYDGDKKSLTRDRWRWVQELWDACGGKAYPTPGTGIRQDYDQFYRQVYKESWRQG